MTNQQKKCQALARLHQGPEAFVVPNPWDLGSARLLQGLGFAALATTSAGFAFTRGSTDGGMTLEETLAHYAQLAQNTLVPITADGENGFADDPETLARHVMAIVNTGVAGCSIEDYNPDTGTIYDFTLAAERVQAVVEAIGSLDFPFQLTARSENFFRGINNIDDTIKRLKAFEKAGAHVLYAPGITSLDQLRNIACELHSPVNVLAPPIKGASVMDLQAAGARRISIGGALTWACVKPLLDAGREMLTQGTFTWTETMASRDDVIKLLGR